LRGLLARFAAKRALLAAAVAERNAAAFLGLALGFEARFVLPNAGETFRRMRVALLGVFDFVISTF
jgi:hypothetical protein